MDHEFSGNSETPIIFICNSGSESMKADLNKWSSIARICSSEVNWSTFVMWTCNDITNWTVL